MSTPRSMRSKSCLITVIATSLAVVSCDKADLEKDEGRAEVREGFDADLGGPADFESGQYLIIPQQMHSLACDEGTVYFNGECCTLEEVAERVEEDDNKALAEVQNTHDTEKKAKASSRLLKNQEKSVGLAESKLDEILADLKAEEAARDTDGDTEGDADE